MDTHYTHRQNHQLLLQPFFLEQKQQSSIYKWNFFLQQNFHLFQTTKPTIIDNDHLSPLPKKISIFLSYIDHVLSLVCVCGHERTKNPIPKKKSFWPFENVVIFFSFFPPSSQFHYVIVSYSHLFDCHSQNPANETELNQTRKKNPI